VHFLRLRFSQCVLAHWQLQYRRLLTRAQQRQQHYLSIWEFDCIMMDVRPVLVDLVEPTNLVMDCPLLFVKEDSLGSTEVTLDFSFERNLGTGNKAHGHLWFADRRKATREGIPKLGRYQFVSDLRRSRCNTVETIVAHSRGLQFCVDLHNKLRRSSECSQSAVRERAFAT
jgi:hypothetical protein